MTHAARVLALALALVVLLSAYQPIGGEPMPAKLYGVDAFAATPALVSVDPDTGTSSTITANSGLIDVYAAAGHNTNDELLLLLRGSADGNSYTRVRKVDSTGATIWQWEHDKAGARHATWYITTDPQDRIYVVIQTSSSTAEVVCLTDAGAEVWVQEVENYSTFSANTPPVGATYGPKAVRGGSIVWVKGTTAFVSGSYRTTVLALDASDGSVLARTEPGSNANHHLVDAVVTDDGELWTARTGTARFTRWTYSGGSITEVGDVSLSAQSGDAIYATVIENDVVYWGGQPTFDYGYWFGAVNAVTSAVAYEVRTVTAEEQYGIVGLALGPDGVYCAIDQWGGEPELLYLSSVDGAAVGGFTGAARSEGYLVIASTGVHGAVVIQEATARVRSNVSVDAGSILRATRLLAVEADATEDFLEATTLDQTQLKAFREAMAPDDIALVYYPAGVQNQERLHAYAGETILGRMALTYPPRIMDTVANLSGDVDTAWSLTSALTYIFEQWATEYPWFRYEDVPDLRMARPDGDYADGKGTPSTGVIGIPQSETNRKSMRDIVDEFLSAVPGAVLTASTTGELRIVPRDGPDADAAPFKTLDGDDAYQVSTGFPDQRSSVNGAIVTNRGWTKEEAVSVMSPSWFSIRQAGTPSDKYLTPPSNALDLTTSTLLGATAAPGIWPVADEDTVLDTDAVLTWTDPDTTDLLLAGQVRYYLYPSGSIDHTNDTATEPELEFENVTDLVLDGAWHEVFTLRRTFASGAHDGYHVTMEARFNEEQGGVEFRVSDAKLSGGFWDGGTYWTSGQATFGITLDALGNRWGNSVTRTARFTLANGDTLIGEGGTNALEDSVTAYGERVDTINISVFDLDPETLGLIAQAHVLRNINPTTIRTVEQSAWRAFPIKFDDVGRLIQLPSSEEGYVLNRRYSDDFGIDYAEGSLSSSIDVEVVTTSDQLLGDTSGFLFSDDGSLFVMDDGTPSEVN